MPSFDDLRRYLLGQLNAAVRRPGMYGGEAVILTLLDALAFADDRTDRWQNELEALVKRGAANAAMVSGAVHEALGHRSEDVMASVYADLAHRQGWLSLDADSRIPGVLGERDCLLDDVIAEYGEPPLWLGGTNPKYSKTLGYPDRSGSLVFFHFMPEMRLMATRRGEGGFRDSFVFTPAGLSR
ncbi:hypothetical protein [Lentzea cavernae]|uniref:Uncharacterized protein n=1 Tax=Lentzea cavernae TaxID=2020703 RepID=A0ABQ3MXJ2_9PSEU|nr:hypothetical protein [Lentzea cavernae]GHH53129.1 hypothetical protein GCM10017774_66140 [Lentzea cavernae]